MSEATEDRTSCHGMSQITCIYMHWYVSTLAAARAIRVGPRPAANLKTETFEPGATCQPDQRGTDVTVLVHVKLNRRAGYLRNRMMPPWHHDPPRCRSTVARLGGAVSRVLPSSPLTAACELEAASRSIPRTEACPSLSIAPP
jgi:hypothetical protein